MPLNRPAPLAPANLPVPPTIDDLPSKCARVPDELAYPEMRIVNVPPDVRMVTVPDNLSVATSRAVTVPGSVPVAVPLWYSVEPLRLTSLRFVLSTTVSVRAD